METKKAINDISEMERLSPVWMKAAIVGGLWASVEIIVGSFLHNLRIPFSGTFLTMQGIMILTAFYRLWPERGLIWRAGLICALMKSVSPSSVILGPMSGIFFEAILLEAGIRLIGSNYFGFVLGGVLGLMSTLIHKIISLLILYGLDIVKILENLYYFIVKQIRIQNANPWTIVIIFLIVYVILGVISATLGFYIGNKSKNTKRTKTLGFKLSENKQNEFFNLDPNKKYSLLFFFIHFCMIPLGLISLNFFNPYFAISLVFIYLIFCIFYYKNSLRRLKKPIFWIQLLIIIIIASIFWNGINSKQDTFNIKGFIVGLEMCLRAVFVVIAFSSLSIELRNPLIKSFLTKKGLQPIYQSVSLAFSALPMMIASMPRPLEIIKRPIFFFVRINLQADEWLDVFKKQNINNL